MVWHVVVVVVVSEEATWLRVLLRLSHNHSGGAQHGVGPARDSGDETSLVECHRDDLHRQRQLLNSSLR
jgi:hypothetical protein